MTAELTVNANVFESFPLKEGAVVDPDGLLL